MTPSEKVEELIGMFGNHANYPRGGATLKEDFQEHLEETKKCALICVKEVNKQINVLFDSIDHISLSKYWQDVKEEIEKL